VRGGGPDVGRAAIAESGAREHLEEEETMRKALEIGGLVAAVVLFAFGVAAIVLGAGGRNTVRDNLSEQKIVGTPDMTPAAITAEARKAGLDTSKLPIPTCSVAGQRVESGSSARCFAEYMVIHALEGTGGLYYSQMPRYATANGAGTNVESAALKGPSGKPLENPARGVWVQENALATALNTSYMADQISLFGIVVGVALLLSGVGFGVLAVGGALRNPETAFRFLAPRAGRPAGAVTPSATGA
jgi:F0F1-type ATP synthase membrane subunit c/vacuolar-type H+-ATPase subunit K